MAEPRLIESKMLAKLRNNFKLALVVLFGSSGVAGVTPFAIYRFANGQTLAGMVDLLILSCISAGVLYAWRTGRTEGPAHFLAVTCAAGSIAAAHVSGLSGVLWMYPVLIAIFMLVGLGTAATISLIAIVSVFASDLALPLLSEKLMFVSSALVVSLFAYLFASRSEHQRAQLESIAALDSLTGAYNRRGLDAELEVAMASSMRTGHPLGVLVFDIDHFKRINDSFGHEVGDAVLVQLAQLTRRCTRRGDRFFRLGGEEFGLLVPGADGVSLPLIAEKLRATIEDELRCNGSPITVSIGATWFVPGESATEMLARADAAMYRAKHKGRNRVVANEKLPEQAARPVPDPAARRRSAVASGD